MAGKSTVLRSLRQALAGGRTVLALDVPIQRSSPAYGRIGFGGVADDAAGVILASAAAQLLSFDQGLPESVTAQDVSWDDKVSRVRQAVHRAVQGGGCTLLIDGPEPVVPEDAFASLFSVRTYQLVQELIQTPGVSCVLSRRTSVPPAHRVQVRPEAPATAILDPTRWNGLGESAQQLSDASRDVSLEDYSPLELRLLVAAVHAGEPATVLVRERPRARQLVKTLFRRLGNAGEKLRSVLGRLAVLRTDFPPRLLHAFGADSLDREARRILEHAVLFGDARALRLHEVFAHEAALSGWLTPGDRRDTHMCAAEHHRERFRTARDQRDVHDALRHEIEVFHHLTEAGDARACEHARWFFVEQLDALGKSLSLMENYDGAVRCYERVIERAPTDWYAQHYLAWNLDVDGKDAKRVETGYGRARELAPDHVWHHGRLICFYVTRSRTKAAEDAWARARAYFGFRSEESDERFYKELHRPLARLLLHRGQLSFAREVLEDVPMGLRDELRWWEALDRLLERLEEAELERVVFPPHIPREERWTGGPHTLVGTKADVSVTRWIPGRISGIDEAGVHIRIATREDDGEVAFGWRDYSRKEFDRRCRYSPKLTVPAGTFLEIVTIGERDENIFLHPPVRDRDLPGLFPRPDRYVRRSAAGTE